MNKRMLILTLAAMVCVCVLSSCGDKSAGSNSTNPTVVADSATEASTESATSTITESTIGVPTAPTTEAPTPPVTEAPTAPGETYSPSEPPDGDNLTDLG